MTKGRCYAWTCVCYFGRAQVRLQWKQDTNESPRQPSLTLSWEFRSAFRPRLKGIRIHTQPDSAVFRKRKEPRGLPFATPRSSIIADPKLMTFRYFFRNSSSFNFFTISTISALQIGRLCDLIPRLEMVKNKAAYFKTWFFKSRW